MDPDSGRNFSFLTVLNRPDMPLAGAIAINLLSSRGQHCFRMRHDSCIRTRYLMRSDFAASRTTPRSSCTTKFEAAIPSTMALPAGWIGLRKTSQ